MKNFSLTPLTDVLSSLEFALNNQRDNLTRDAAIQRFEYTYELAWKSLKRYFFLNNTR